MVSTLGRSISVFLVKTGGKFYLVLSKMSGKPTGTTNTKRPAGAAGAPGGQVARTSGNRYLPLPLPPRRVRTVCCVVIMAVGFRIPLGAWTAGNTQRVGSRGRCPFSGVSLKHEDGGAIAVLWRRGFGNWDDDVLGDQTGARVADPAEAALKLPFCRFACSEIAEGLMRVRGE